MEKDGHDAREMCCHGMEILWMVWILKNRSVFLMLREQGKEEVDLLGSRRSFLGSFRASVRRYFQNLGIVLFELYCIAGTLLYSNFLIGLLPYIFASQLCFAVFVEMFSQHLVASSVDNLVLSIVRFFFNDIMFLFLRRKE